MPEHLPSNFPKLPESGISQAERSTAGRLEELPRLLGFAETPALSALRVQAIEAYAEPEPVTAAGFMRQYRDEADKVISTLPAAAVPRTLLGVNIAIGNVQREAGWFSLAIPSYEDAYEHARELEYSDPELSSAAELLDAGTRDNPGDRDVYNACRVIAGLDEIDYQNMLAMGSQDAVLDFIYDRLFNCGIRDSDGYLLVRGIFTTPL